MLMQELSSRCKPYDLQVYAKERHGIRAPAQSEHYETNFLWYLIVNL